MAPRMRRLTSLLASPRLAVALLVALGVYSFIGTLVPQGRDTAAVVRQWDTAHVGLAPLVGVLGLHQAFSSPVFVALAILLACATAVCAWRRTAVARRRSSALRALRRGETAKAVASPTFAIETEADRSEAIDRAESALREAGLGAKRAGDTLVLASNPATVWGSTVFHWALVALLAVVVLSALVRSDGLIGIPRGESRSDVPRPTACIREDLCTPQPRRRYGLVWRSSKWTTPSLTGPLSALRRPSRSRPNPEQFWRGSGCTRTIPSSTDRWLFTATPPAWR